MSRVTSDRVCPTTFMLFWRWASSPPVCRKTWVWAHPWTHLKAFGWSSKKSNEDGHDHLHLLREIGMGTSKI